MEAIRVSEAIWCMSATTDTHHHPRQEIQPAYTWVSARQTYSPAMQAFVPTVFSCVASRNKQEPRLPVNALWACPGLPRESQWRAEQRRQPRVQLFVGGQRYQWHELGFRRDAPQYQQRERPHLRSSIALPLGINGDRAARPGLPRWRQSGYPRRSGVCQQQQILLIIHDRRYSRHISGFQHDGPTLQQYKHSCPRYSAALPLGINRGRAAIESRLGLPQPTAASPPTPKDCRLSENNRRKTSPPPQQSPRTPWSCEKKTLS